jgi:hypothetical protein
LIGQGITIVGVFVAGDFALASVRAGTVCDYGRVSVGKATEDG